VVKVGQQVLAIPAVGNDAIRLRVFDMAARTLKILFRARNIHVLAALSKDANNADSAFPLVMEVKGIDVAFAGVAKDGGGLHCGRGRV
jgi:hypothetical protein